MDMVMGSSSSMSSSMMSMTPTSAAGMSSSTGKPMGGMGGMDMGGGACKISMLWNWYTVDACEPECPFIAIAFRTLLRCLFAPNNHPSILFPHPFPFASLYAPYLPSPPTWKEC